MFADAEDERQQYTMVIHNVVRKLKVDGEPVGDDGAWQIDGVTVTHVPRPGRADRRPADRRRRRCVDWAGRAVGHGHDQRVRAPAAVVAARARRTWCAPTSRSAPTGTCAPRTSAQVTVVDIHNLADRAQRFVVGVTLQRAFEEKEESGARRPLLFVVLDELNKYAPREGQSPIKELLLDIAERGRSLGIILVGAQQTASEVERRVIANSALRVAGRLDPAEAMRPEYGFLPAAHRERARIAKPGTMFVSQPEIPVPLVAEFPFPAWATRPDEVRRRRRRADAATGDVPARPAPRS